MSTSWTNCDSDIISMSPAFRNTAVSALLGCLPDSETYRNPHLSSCSLQLDTQTPGWGFEGFPKRVYISTGSAEISYDQVSWSLLCSLCLSSYIFSPHST